LPKGPFPDFDFAGNVSLQAECDSDITAPPLPDGERQPADVLYRKNPKAEYNGDPRILSQNYPVGGPGSVI
jgi:hypothetical protein